MGDYSYSAGDRLVAGLTEAAAATRIQNMLNGLAEFMGAKSGGAASIMDWTNIAEDAGFREEHLAATTVTNTNFTLQGSGRSLTGDVVADVGLTTGSINATSLRQRVLALRKKSGHIRAAQTHRAKVLLLRGQKTVTMTGDTPGPADATKTVTVNWTTADADEANNQTIATPYSSTIRPFVMPNGGAGASWRFSTDLPENIPAIVVPQVDTGSLGANGFDVRLVQYEWDGANWQQRNTNNANRTYALDWFAVVYY